ncbi:MAG: transketolase C-terminal domain-containing protein, partial [Candidatus Methylomirabilota bacterium]
MRNAFAAAITALAAEDPRIVLLSGDIGNRLFDAFKERQANRFFNCGVAEANMVSVAAGMALCGLRPVTYTIASFMTTRCFEQIRVDVCYHHLPVVIVGVGAGLAYATNGGTHHTLEDIAILRALPEMTVVCPADSSEVRLAVREALACRGPVYLRLGKKGERPVHATPPAFRLGEGIVLRRGTNVCLLGTGNMVATALDVAERLAAAGQSAEVVSLHTVKPLDEALLGRVCAEFPVIATLEEHSVLGGLGGAVAEWQADRPALTSRLLRFGTADRFLHEAGGQEHCRDLFGLSSEKILARILVEL